MNIVLDACALIAYLRNEVGAEVVESILFDTNTQCCAHAVNICEVYYDFLRVSDNSEALAAIAEIELAGVILREDLDKELWQYAGQVKARNRVSLADCFAVALATRLSAE